MMRTNRSKLCLAASAALAVACGDGADLAPRGATGGSSATGTPTSTTTGAGAQGGGGGAGGGDGCVETAPLVWQVTEGACTVLYEWGGDTEEEHLGRALASGGDHDGDGHDDLFVSSRDGVQIRSADGTTLASIDGTAEGSYAAHTLDHDVSGDGVPDIGLTFSICPEEDGAGGGPVTSPDEPCAMGARSLDAVSGALLAEMSSVDRLETVADRDGDAVADYAVRTQMDLANMIPAVIELRSSNDGGTLATLSGSNDPYEWQFGSGLRDVGDVDGDGASDLVVTVINVLPNASTIVLYSGKDDQVITSHAPPLGVVGELWGSHIERAGDVDGDGRMDLLVSDYLRHPQGALHAFSGADLSMVWTDEYLDGSAGDLGSDRTYGLTFQRAGDLDGDGVEDAVVAGPKYGMDIVIGAFGAVVRLVSGATGVSFATLEETITDGMRGYHLGQSIATLPDRDGDGRSEIVLSAPDAPNACRPGAGRVLVLSCAAPR